MERLIICLVLSLLVLSFVGLAIYAIWSERRDWNGGVAPSGQPWQMFDMDSQGGRGYKDPDGPSMIWVSWPVDK